MSVRLNSLFLAAAVVATPRGASLAQAKAPQTDDQKTLYALGAVIDKQMKLSIFNLSAEDMEWVKAGLADSALGGKVNEEFLNEWGPKIESLARTRMQAVAGKEKQDGQAYLAKAATEPGAKQLPSGVIYRELKAGTGANPKPDDTVTVHYHGTLINGKVFDSSVDRKTPSTFGLDSVISCWVEGLQLIKVGGKAKLVCPSDQAFGDMGSPPDIRPGATLIFELDLLSIQAAAAEKTPADSGTPPPAP